MNYENKSQAEINLEVEINNQTDKIARDYDLDFTIAKCQTFIEREGLSLGTNGFEKTTEKILTPYYVLLNESTGEALNSVKEGYTITQTKEVIRLILHGLENIDSNLRKNVKITKGGQINGGRKIFLQFEIDSNTNIDGDAITRYITVVDSNDGTTGLSIGIGDETASCTNQFYQFNKNADFKFKHTKSIDENLKRVSTLIENAFKLSLDTFKLYQEFNKVDVTPKQVQNMIKFVYGHNDESIQNSDSDKPQTRIVNNLKNIEAHIQKEMKSKGNTIWGLHSGFTSWTTNGREDNAPKRDNGHIESLMLGANYKYNDNSFKYAKKLLTETV